MDDFELNLYLNSDDTCFGVYYLIASYIFKIGNCKNLISVRSKALYKKLLPELTPLMDRLKLHFKNGTVEYATLVLNTLLQIIMVVSEDEPHALARLTMICYDEPKDATTNELANFCYEQLDLLSNCNEQIIDEIKIDIQKVIDLLQNNI